MCIVIKQEKCDLQGITQVMYDNHLTICTKFYLLKQLSILTAVVMIGHKICLIRNVTKEP